MRRTRERVLGLLDDDELSPEQERRQEHGMPSLELSVVIPARNEEQNLPECLDSLIRQSEPGFALGMQWEIIVVDDESSDRTFELACMAQSRAEETMIFGAAVSQPLNVSGPNDAQMPTEPATARAPTAGAAQQPPFRVLRAPAQGAHASLTGKSNACWTGAQLASGRRLLFLDADTLSEPEAISRSLREAERHEVALLSYSPRQIVTGVAQQLVMPLIFSELATVYPPHLVNDPANTLAAANGQFLLVDRVAYFAAGGHRALGLDILEDVALARRLKRAGESIRLRYAPEALAARMYRTNGAMIEGWTKNLAALMPSPVALALWRLLDLLLLVSLPLLAAGVAHLVLWQRAALLLLWLRTGLRFYTRVAQAHFGVGASAISPLGIPLLIFLLLRSAAAYRIQHRVLWRGRSYDPNRA